MNILFLDQFSDLGGGQQCLLDLLPAIQKRDWTAHLCIPGSGPLFQVARPFCASIAKIPCGPFHSGNKGWTDLARLIWQLPFQVRVISRLIREREIDVVYVNGARLLPSAAFAVKEVPMLFHCNIPVVQRAAAALAEYCVQRRKATVIVNSRLEAKLFESLVPSERLHLVYNGVRAFPEAQPPLDGKLRIGLIGRIAPEKGQLEFVQAVQLMGSSASNCRFIICGAPLFGDPEYFRRVKAASEGLPIEFMGWLDDISPVLSNLHLLVVPSGASEATTRTIPEAYSAGVPVIAFPNAALPEMVEHGRTGWLVEPTPSALASKLRELIANPAQLTEMRGYARTAWQERFTRERYQREIVEILERFDPANQRTPLQSAGQNVRK